LEKIRETEKIDKDLEIAETVMNEVMPGQSIADLYSDLNTYPSLPRTELQKGKHKRI
jgi:hypothetical protein